MGMRKSYIDFIENHAANIIGDLKGKSMLELGDQVLKNMKGITSLKTGKEYFSNKGIEHISIDLNGKRGSLKLNLSKPIINPNWINYFDIITNLGTTEHIEPQSSQYICFRTLHNFLKPKGIIIHVLPDIESMDICNFNTKHSNNYYKSSFFDMLTCNNKVYELIEIQRKGFNFLVCMKKISDNTFMEDIELFNSHLIRREGGTIWKGINDEMSNNA